MPYAKRKKHSKKNRRYGKRGDQLPWHPPQLPPGSFPDDPSKYTRKWNYRPQDDHSGKVMVSNAFIKGSTLNAKQKRKYHDSPSLEYQYCSSWSLASGAGVGINPGIYTITDIQSVFSGNALNGQLVAETFSSSTAQQALKPVTRVNANVSVLVKNFEWTFEMTNMAPNVTFCTLYICKARDDTGSTTNVPSLVWENAVDDQAGVDATYGTAAIVSKLWPFGKPKPNASFRESWTIIHTKDLDFDPGETKRHVVNCQINKERDFADIVENSAGYLKGISHYAFIVGRGGPADTSNTTAVGTIEFSPCKIIGVSGIKQRITVAEKASKILNQYNGLPTAGAANLYTMNDDSGAAVNVNTVNYG